MLVTNDVNARTLSEIENVSTFSLRDVTRALHTAGGDLQRECEQLWLLCAPPVRHLLGVPHEISLIRETSWQQALGALDMLHTSPDPNAMLE